MVENENISGNSRNEISIANEKPADVVPKKVSSEIFEDNEKQSKELENSSIVGEKENISENSRNQISETNEKSVNVMPDSAETGSIPDLESANEDNLIIDTSSESDEEVLQKESKLQKAVKIME